MSWAAINTRILTNPAIRQLPSPSHKLLWLSGRLHCAEFETDGLIETSALPLLAFTVGIDVDQARQMVLGLQECGLWKPCSQGWLDVTFSDENPTHEARERGRARDRSKKQKRRTQPIAPGDTLGGHPGGTAPGDNPGEVHGAQIQIQRQPQGLRHSPLTVLTHSGSPLSGAAAEVARFSNGQGKFHVTTTDVDPHARIYGMLTEALDAGKLLRKSDAVQRWVRHIDQLTPELAARTDISESTLRRRAREFFQTAEWIRRGDSQEADWFRRHMLKPVKTRNKAVDLEVTT
jgi:hypothetical protein